jgi:hypothetical protein
VLSGLPSPDTQSRCLYCDEILQSDGGRGRGRPREYCSDAHRKAAARTRGAAPEVLSQRSAENNAPTGESTENGVENPHDINGRINGQNGPSVPLDLFGSGYRWPGAKTPTRAAKAAAAADVELGVGGPPIVSVDGVVAAIVLPRKRRSSRPAVGLVVAS